MNAFELDAIVAKYDLNEHPFYRAWRAGTLPPAALRAYAAEYAPFIGAVEQGWRTLGDEAHAAEEREHARLWERFRDAWGPTEAPACAATAALAATAREAFGETASAVGALYAFEAQQPSTARSKLDGLREHYGFGSVDARGLTVPEEAAAYFREHADDYGEREGLRARWSDLGADGVARARAACEAMCQAMWAALDGVLAQSAPGLRCA
jgi:pyrroloquinoline-quinone synthase